MTILAPGKALKLDPSLHNFGARSWRSLTPTAGVLDIGRQVLGRDSKF